MSAGEVITTSATGAQKAGNLERFDLIPVEALRELAEHYGRGAKKYEDRNWEKGYEWGKSYAALTRHLTQFWAGEDIDPETGSKHITAVAWHAFALSTFMDQHPEFDDRPTTLAALKGHGGHVHTAAPLTLVDRSGYGMVVNPGPEKYFTINNGHVPDLVVLDEPYDEVEAKPEGWPLTEAHRGYKWVDDDGYEFEHLGSGCWAASKGDRRYRYSEPVGIPDAWGGPRRVEERPAGIPGYTINGGEPLPTVMPTLNGSLWTRDHDWVVQYADGERGDLLYRWFDGHNGKAWYYRASDGAWVWSAENRGSNLSKGALYTRVIA